MLAAIAAARQLRFSLLSTALPCGHAGFTLSTNPVLQSQEQLLQQLCKSLRICVCIGHAAVFSYALVVVGCAVLPAADQVRRAVDIAFPVELPLGARLPRSRSVHHGSEA